MTFDLITVVEDKALVSHETIADSINNDPKNVLGVIRKYQDEMEQVGGKVAFETRLNNRGSDTVIAMLNEAQASLLLTFLRNNDKVVRFKVRLVQEFMRYREGKPMSRLELAKLQVKMIEELEAKEAEVKALKVELDESHEWATIKRVEQLTGEPFDWRHLKRICDEHGIERKDIFDANYGSVKSYHADAWRLAYGIDLTKL